MACLDQNNLLRKERRSLPGALRCSEWDQPTSPSSEAWLLG